MDTNLGSFLTDTWQYVRSVLSNPLVLIVLVVVLGIYIIGYMSLGSTADHGNGNDESFLSFSTIDDGDGIAGNPTSTDFGSGISSIFITMLIILALIMLLGINGIHYLFGIDVFAQLKNFFSSNPEVDITVQTDNTGLPEVAPVPEIKLIKQVFNIPGNEYGYNDAKALCSAYGARLATYEEVENAYNSGGEWCNYGWSDGQMALYPTQQKTYDELQKIEGHENDCGRPGVNGGYMANPKLKFGVNCFGYKPRMNSTEETLMANEPLYPKTMKDIAMEKRVDYWKGKLTEILVSPFNHNSWSKL